MLDWEMRGSCNNERGLYEDNNLFEVNQGSSVKDE